MLQEILDWLAGTPKENTLRLADVKPGRIALIGKIHTDEPVMAPIAKSRCAGYFYHSTHMVGSRMRGFMRRRLRDALTYAPSLRLELEGGAVRLQPLRSDEWTPDDHLVLLGEGYEGFQATEKIIRDGARVRVIGRAVHDPAGEGWEVKFNELYLLDEKTARTRTGEDVLPRGFKKSKRKGQQRKK